jgi:hypothetical protein
MIYCTAVDYQLNNPIVPKGIKPRGFDTNDGLFVLHISPKGVVCNCYVVRSNIAPPAGGNEYIPPTGFIRQNAHLIRIGGLLDL